MTLERAGFGARLAYARWLAHLTHGDAPSNAEIGRAVGFSGQWASQWQRRVDAPTDPSVRRTLARYLGAPEAWLFDGQGAAPEPDLWVRWDRARRRARRVSGAHTPAVEVSAGEDITREAEEAAAAAQRKPRRRRA